MAATTTAVASTAVWLSEKVLTSCQPLKLADFTARCVSERSCAVRAGSADGGDLGTLATESNHKERRRQRRRHHQAVSFSGLALEEAAPDGVAGSAAVPPPTRTSCAYGQTALLKRVPHEQLLSATEYRFLLAQFTRPPAQEQMAMWHRDLRKYASGSASAACSSSAAPSSTRARATLDGQLRRARLRPTRVHADTPPPAAVAAKDLRTDPVRARLLQGLRELDESTRRLRARYSLMPPHEPPSAEFTSEATRATRGWTPPVGRRGFADAPSSQRGRTGAATAIAPAACGSDDAAAAAGRAARNALQALTAHARSRAAAIEGNAGGGDDRDDDDIANDAGGAVGANGATDSSGTDEYLRLSTEDVASIVVAASSSEDDTGEHDDSQNAAATTMKTTANLPGAPTAAAGAAVAKRAALGGTRTETRRPQRHPPPTPPLPTRAAVALLLHPREARHYLRGARAAARDFVRRHAEPMRACVVDVATFERRPVGALPLSAIDLQIAARRVRQLRMHYGLAALALHRDATTLRRQLVDGLVARRCV
jgi:hypothetical protein